MEQKRLKKWTDDQQRAINATGDTLVSASAGSGKTSVMVEHILRLVKEGVPLSRILVLVFNNSTAAELKEKIQSKLFEKIAQSCIEEQKKFRNALDEIPYSNISTIDSFCINLSKENFEVLNISPSVMVADETELKAFNLEAEHELNEYFQNDELFDRLTAMVGKRDSEGIFSTLKKLYALYSIQPDSEELLNRLCAPFTSLENSIFEKIILENQFYKTKKYLEAALNITLLLRQDKQFDNAEIFNNFVVFYREILESKSLKELCSLYSSFQSKGSRSKKQVTDIELYERTESILAKLKKLLKDDKDNFESFEKLSLAHEQNAVLFQKLAEVLRQYDLILDGIKREREKFDFNDFERFALELLLKNNSVLKFSHVFLDEYQDVNPLQESIISCLNKNAQIFLVGDTKQSIYGFRLADPEIFLRRQKEYGIEKSIRLNQNFRSHNDILEFVNSVFNVIMTTESCGVDYKGTAKFEIEETKNNDADYCSNDSNNASDHGNFENEKKSSINAAKIVSGIIENKDCSEIAADVLTAIDKDISADEKSLTNDLQGFSQIDERIGIDNDTALNSNYKDNNDNKGNRDGQNEEANSDNNKEFNRVEIHLFEKKEKEKSGAKRSIYKLIDHSFENNLTDSSVAEGMFIAEKIKQIIGKEHYPESGRKYNYGDFAILFRKKNDEGISSIIKTLADCGIPVDNSSLTKSESAEREIITFLRVIDNPTDEVSLAGFLLSYFGGFDENELSKIRIVFPEGSFYNAVKSYAKLDDEIACRLKEKFNLIEKYYLKSTVKNASELIESIFFDSQYYAYIMSKGTRHFQEIMSLVSSLRGKDYAQSLHSFLSAYDYLAGMDRDRVSLKSSNRVTLNTIHKSKGLEFPIVFLIGINKKFSTKSYSDNLILDSGGVAGLMFFDEETRTKHLSPSYIATKIAIKKRETQEEMRLFYVALTRAKYRLFLTGAYEEPSANFLDESKSFLDYLYEAKECGGLDSRLFNFHKSELEGMAKPIRLAPHFSKPDELYLNEIKKQIAFVYPYQAATVTAQKFSVTALNEQKQNENELIHYFDEAAVDNGNLADTENARLRGIAYHKVMERIDFELDGFDEITAFINELVSDEILTEEEAQMISVSEIDRCLKSELIKFAKENIFEREKPFMMYAPLNEVSFKEEHKSICDKVLIQGVIDIVIFGRDGIVIADFKDTSKSDEEIAKSYKWQLYLYKMAVEEAFRAKVAKCAIYSFKSGRTIYI